ncbi:MAG: hypothetical protein RL132_845 [Pseudomonadota bacterium]
MTTPSPAPANLPVNFIRHIVEADLANGRTKRLVTRFPPEPNGYLHFGHAKSICLNFGLARDYEGRCHLRLDDTNPAKEEQEFADAIEAAVRWLGFDWAKHLYFASDYFEQLYDFAQALIESGDAYVDSQSADEMRSNRGTLTSPGQDSVYRKRSIAENLQLFRDMRAGKYPDGAHVLRAKIDMRSPNMNLRDPVLYRIRHAEHHRTGNAWCIYPLYDYAHPLSDAITRYPMQSRVSPTQSAHSSLKIIAPSTTGYSTKLRPAASLMRQRYPIRLSLRGLISPMSCYPNENSLS